jgi:hypothetical protein
MITVRNARSIRASSAENKERPHHMSLIFEYRIFILYEDGSFFYADGHKRFT